jgi:hypothetical protein
LPLDLADQLRTRLEVLVARLTPPGEHLRVDVVYIEGLAVGLLAPRRLLSRVWLLWAVAF